MNDERRYRTLCSTGDNEEHGPMLQGEMKSTDPFETLARGNEEHRPTLQSVKVELPYNLTLHTIAPICMSIHG